MGTASYVGIDISKAFFDVALPGDGKYAHMQLDNCQLGFEQLLGQLKGEVCVMEASGPYYLRLATFLHGKGIAVAVVNPLSVRRFCQMRLVRAKTDKKDAEMIARYGQAEQPKPWEPEPAHMLALKQLQTVATGLQKTLHQHQRQLEALQQGLHMNRQAAASLKKVMAYVQKELEKVQEEMQLLVSTHHGQLQQQLTSIPGLGKKSSLLLIILSGGFTRFAHSKQLIAYLGLSPRVYASGTSVKGKARICKMGMSRARAVFYVCAWSAIKCNKACQALYQRLLARGKAKKLALVAVANKLIRQAFALATKHEYYMEKL